MHKQWDDIQVHRKYIHDLIKFTGNDKLETNRDMPNYPTIHSDMGFNTQRQFKSARALIQTQRRGMRQVRSSFMVRMKNQARAEAYKLFKKYRPSCTPSVNTSLRHSDIRFTTDEVMTISPVYHITTAKLYAMLTPKPDSFFILYSKRIGMLPNDIEVHQIRTIRIYKSEVETASSILAVSTILGLWARHTNIRDARDKLMRVITNKVANEI